MTAVSSTSLNADLLVEGREVRRSGSRMRALLAQSSQRGKAPAAGEEDQARSLLPSKAGLCAELSCRTCLACACAAGTCPLSCVFQLPQHACCVLRMAACQCCCFPRRPVPAANNPDGLPVLFFDGGGYAFPFGLGVAQHLLQAYDVSACPVVSISAGNLAALCVVLEQDPAVVLAELYDAFLDDMLERPLCGFCDDLGVLRETLIRWLPADAHQRASGRLHVTLTSWPGLGFKFVSQFASNAELIDAVVASCSFFGFVWRPVLSCHNGWPGCFVDGGYQNLITPLDPVVDLSVRALKLPPWTRAKYPSSLMPSPAATNSPAQPIDLARALEIMSAAAHDAEVHLKKTGLAERLPPRKDGPVVMDRVELGVQPPVPRAMNRA